MLVYGYGESAAARGRDLFMCEMLGNKDQRTTSFWPRRAIKGAENSPVTVLWQNLDYALIYFDNYFFVVVDILIACVRGPMKER